MRKKTTLKHTSLVLCTLLTAVGLSGCATPATSTIAELDGQVLLADSHIGEAYNTVMRRATSNYEVESQCEKRKIALNVSRRAYLYEICGFNPSKATFARAPLNEVVYHFIDDKLVRVDVRAEGEDALLDQVKQDMQSVFAARGASADQLRDNSYEWIATSHVAGVRAGAGASAGNVHVRLLDQSLLESAEWLAEE